MRMKYFSKFTAVILAAFLVISSGGVLANAAVMEDGFESVSSNAENSITAYSAEDLPSSYSAKEEGFVTDIKKQLYNDCWAYAGLAAFESKLLKNGFNIESMAVDHLNLWATKRSNGKGWQRNRLGEGYTYISSGYLTSWQGGVEQTDLKDFDFSLDYYGDQMPTDLAKYGVTAIKYVDGKDRNEIKNAIMQNGGVFTSYATTSVCYSADNTAYFMPESYTGSYSGHSIEIVGWDDNYSRMSFNSALGEKPKNDGAWLVKNSWGNYNSLDGYFWISYEDKYVFGSKYDPSFTIEQVEKIDSGTKLLQNEIYGATYTYGYIDSEEITYINRFDFDKEFNTLDKVIFETKTAGAEYDVYYIPIENDIPAKDQSKWTRLDGGIVDYNGYICCDFEDFKVPDTDGAIGVKINTAKLNEGVDKADSENYVVNGIGVNEWLVKTDGEYTFINESKSGDSYVCTSGIMMDVMDIYSGSLGDDMGGTLVIKAVTKKTAEEGLLGDVDLDKTLTVMDATYVQKSIVQLIELNDIQKKNADYNGDGIIDVTDATDIQKKIVGIYS